MNGSITAISMAAKKTADKTAENRSARKVPSSRPIRLNDLLPDTDVRGGARKAIVFGQRHSASLPKK